MSWRTQTYTSRISRSGVSVLLDLDGTLLDSRRVADALHATCRWIAEQRPGVDAEMLMLANRRAWQEFWPAVEDASTRGTMDGDPGLEAWRRTFAAVDLFDDELLRAVL